MPGTRRNLWFTLLVILLVTPVVGYAQTALQFVAVAPCRVVDTRWPDGQFGGPPIQGKGSRDFAVPQSACSIPSTAAAYSLNVTVVPQGTLSYLTVWPTGQTKPVISTLNSLDGRIKANAAIVPAGTGGAISVYATNTTDVVLDIDGYFAPATTTTLAFFPLTPCRVADTRWTPGPLGGPQLQGKAERDFPVLSSSCTIPESAQGYSLNFTVVPKVPLGYLTVWPTGQAQPKVSTLNDLTGTIVANAAIVPAGNQGAISVYVTNDTDLVIDIDGYFAPSSSGQYPLSLYTLAPCRVLDTRKSSGTFSGTLPVEVLQSGCEVPSAQAYVLNATVVPLNGQPLGYLTLWPDAEGKPVVSTLNALDGAITSNMAIVPTLNGSVDAFATNPTDMVLDIFSYFAPILPLSITTTSLPSGTLTYNYNATLGASGGVTPYTWSLAVGDNLPPGLNLDASSGVISGTPTVQGTTNFTVWVTDSQSPPATVSAPLSITVNATLTQLSIVTTSLPPGIQNQSYNTMLAATGGVTPYTWSISAGILPAGLYLNASTGAISGTPTGGGISNFTVQVTDSESPAQTATQPLSITITPAVPLSITTTSLPSGTAGVAYSAPLTAIGGVYPYTWAITVGSLPAGLKLNPSTGAITGTPTASGTANFTAQVTDSETPPVSVTAQLSITINPGVVKITTTSLPNGIDGTPYSATVTASGGLTPYAWSIVPDQGNLPSGLSLNSSSGAITGTPTVVGTAYFTVQVTDSEVPQVSATAALSITINSAGGGGDPGVLKGNYAFYLNGFTSSGAWTLAGSFISDGKGNITSGEVDGNSVAGQPFNTTVSGSYSISTTGLNTVTLQGSSYGPVTFAFVLDSTGNGRIIEYDDTTGQGSRGSGVLRKADPTAFSLSKLNGGWVYGMAGVSPHGARNVSVAQFTLNNGNITNGTEDKNSGGSYQTSTFTGSMSAVDPQTGRAVFTFTVPGFNAHIAVYVVSTGELVTEPIESVQESGVANTVGSVLKQSGTFNNGSLNGLAVTYFQSVGGGGDDRSDAAIVSCDGNGNCNVLTQDYDDAGTITQKPPQQATYTVAANGAVTFTGSGNVPAGFLISQNKGFMVSVGENPDFYWWEPQTGGPFSNQSFKGTYAGGSLAPLDYVNADNQILTGSADGNGNSVLNADDSGPGGLHQSLNVLVTYDIASNGRGTASPQGSQQPSVIYVISPTKIVSMDPDTEARISVIEY